MQGARGAPQGALDVSISQQMAMQAYPVHLCKQRTGFREAHEAELELMLLKKLFEESQIER